MKWFVNRSFVIGVLSTLLVVEQLVIPVSLAQVEPGQDPYALTPEKLRMFQGYQASSSAGSLFNGDDMKYNGLFSTPMTQLGGAAPLYGPTVTNLDTAQFLILTSHHGDMIITKVAGIPYNRMWDTAGGYARFMAWDNEMQSYGIPNPDAARIALAWTRNWCNDPNASPKPAPTDPDTCGFDFTGVDPKESAGPYDDQCQTWGVDYQPDWKNHTGGPTVNCAQILLIDPTRKRTGMGVATQCGTTALNAQTCTMAQKDSYDYSQPPEGWKIPMTLTAQNIGTVDITNITLKAQLQDHNGLVAFHAPTPPEPDPPFDTTSNLNGDLVWTQINGKPFNLRPQQSQTFTWAVYPTKVNSVLRWVFTALFGSGESILLHWIPVYWPMQGTTAGSGGGGGGGTIGGGTSPAACGQPTPTSNIAQAIQQTFGIKMMGFTDQYLGYAWDEFCAVSKTKFFTYLQGISIDNYNGVGASYNTSFCSASEGPAVELKSYDFSDNGQFFKFIITHELGHTIARCSTTGQAAQVASGNARSQEGAVSWYGANAEYYWCTVEGDSPCDVTDVNEDFADSVAYYLNSTSTLYTLGPNLPTNNTNYPAPNPFFPSDQRPKHFAVMQQLLGG